MGPDSSGRRIPRRHSEEGGVAAGGTVDVAGDMSEGGPDGCGEGGRSDSGSPWSPCSDGGAFRPYSSPGPGSSGLRVIVKKPMVVRLTKDIVETYQLCNANFKYSEALNPKRFLTSPHNGVLNEGYDNANSDLILSVNLVLVGPQQRYVVKEMLGQGTFGQVAKCWVAETNSHVAVKIIKNQPAYYQQALVEVSILAMLNKKFDPDDKHHIVRILDYFVYQRHLCISFEMLGSNLYELLKVNQYKGLSLSIVQEFSQQILHALIVMKDAGIIHCDLKPENILLCPRVKPTAIKIIDFGSACKEGRTIYSYIQSRYYRSPEVLLGYPYNTAIDMWSVGCIVAELFLGLPLFPGASEFDLLKRMIEILGGQPPDDVLREAKNTSKFFKHVGSIHSLENYEPHKGCPSAYRILTEEEYEARELKKPVIGKRYFKFVKLEDIIANYPYRRNLPEEEMSKESLKRLALVDFLRGLVEFDPAKRWSPLQASRHPFVTGEPFACPYKPLPVTPHIPVIHTVTVDHNPGGGHWLATGLSPQVSNVNRGIRQNSPHFRMGSLPHVGSYGSYGSYNDNAFLGSSYGSYGDGNTLTFYSPAGPSGTNIQAQVGGSILGASPDTRHRPQFPHGSGFGMSPAGNFGPMSLGASPSQFTPPSSQMQVPTISPGKYGPTSPARGSVHGSPLGKAAAVAQYNRRRNWGHQGSLGIQSQESTSQHWQGHHGDGISYSQLEGNFQGHFGSLSNAPSASNHPSWRQQRGGNRFSSGFSSTVYQNFPPSYPLDPSFVPSHSSDVSSDKYESSSSLPDPGDWDPNYSDELLLQEDSSVMGYLASEVTNNMRLGRSMDTAVLTSGVGRYSHGHNPTHTNVVLGNQRTDELVQAHANAEGSPHMGHDMHANYNRLSRFGQQPVHRINHMQSTSLHSDRICQMGGQLTRSNYTSADSHSPANDAFGGGTSWD